MVARTLRWVVMVCLAVLLGGAGAAVAGPFTNGGFETGSLYPWFQDPGRTWNVRSVDAHSGTFSARSRNNKEIRQDFDGILVGDILEISFWAKHPQRNATTMFVDLFYSDSTDTGVILSPSTQDWEFFDVTENAVAGKTLVGFSVFGNTWGRTFLDDVRITSVTPEPGTGLLVMVGLLGLGLYPKRQRRAATTKGGH